MTEIPAEETPPAGHIALSNGRLVDPVRVRREDLDVLPILVALSRQGRFAGHTPFRHYSVLQHSIVVGLLCDEADTLAGFAHDFGEAFLPDIPTPIKSLPWMAPWREAEASNDRVIADWLGVPSLRAPSVITADRLALALEARSLLHPDAHRFFAAPSLDIARTPRVAAAIRVVGRTWEPGEALLQGQHFFSRARAGSWYAPC